MITIKQYTESDYELFDDFIKHSINGTIFHEQKFLSYHGKDKFKDNSLLFYENNKLIAVFPAATIKKNNKTILKSHPGTSYGGLVIKDNIHFAQINQVYSLIEKFCIENNIKQIEFRHSPKIFLTEHLDQIEYCLVSRGYEREAQELSTCYNLKNIRHLTFDKLIAYYNNETKTKVRQNFKKSLAFNIKFEFINDKNEINKFYRILENNLKKYNTEPVHTIEELYKLLELYPERVKIAVTKLGSDILSGFFIFNINKKGWHIFYSALDYSKVEYRPVHFGLIHLKKYLADMSYEYLNYGISTENSGKYLNQSLLNFKESFNGQGILRTYWIKEL